jgi:hypothetical protein
MAGWFAKNRIESDFRKVAQSAREQGRNEIGVRRVLARFSLGEVCSYRSDT